MEKEFWKKKSLSELSHEEWEALCDHCGKCCLVKYNVLDKTIFTNFHCKHLNPMTCRCKIYDQRLKLDDCIGISLEMLSKQPYLLPNTCAYKLLFQGKDLPEWHPLITGTYQSVIDSQHSIRCFETISEECACFSRRIILDSIESD